MSEAATAIERARAPLSLSPEMYRLYFEYASDAIIAVEISKLRIQVANRRLEEMTGHRVEELIGQSAALLFPERETGSGDGRDFCPEVLERPGLHEDLRMRRADDHSFFASVAINHVPGDDGLVAVCVLRDSTERRLLERELITKHAALRQAHEELLAITRRAENRNKELVSLSGRMASLAKMAAVGAFTAGVAHSFNNPLAALLSACRQTQKLLDSDADLGTVESRQRLALLQRRKTDAAQRLQQVLEQVRRIHRGGSPRGDRVPVNVVNEIETALTLFQHRLDQVRVARRFSTVPDVPAYPDELQYLFSNVIDNALLAIEHSGHLDIEVTCRDSLLRVAITDDGPGITPEQADEIFNPFSTSRPDGTGLGLSIARRIALHQGGQLFVDLDHRSGARFVLEIPVTDPPPQESETPEPNDEQHHGH